MITPVNGHLLIEPLKSDGFISSSSDTFQEIGIVIDVDANGLAYGVNGTLKLPVKVGDKVYFDAWLAAKFPKGNTGEFLWLVKWEDVRAIEHEEIPK